MNEIHTTACGTEPFDKCYGVGYQVGHASWTPYPRVERMQKAFFEKPYYIDLEPYFFDFTHTFMDPAFANDGLHPDIMGKMIMAEVINSHKEVFKQ